MVQRVSPSVPRAAPARPQRPQFRPQRQMSQSDRVNLALLQGAIEVAGAGVKGVVQVGSQPGGWLDRMVTPEETLRQRAAQQRAEQLRAISTSRAQEAQAAYYGQRAGLEREAITGREDVQRIREEGREAAVVAGVKQRGLEARQTAKEKRDAKKAAKDKARAARAGGAGPRSGKRWARDHKALTAIVRKMNIAGLDPTDTINEWNSKEGLPAHLKLKFVPEKKKEPKSTEAQAKVLYELRKIQAAQGDDTSATTARLSELLGRDVAPHSKQQGTKVPDRNARIAGGNLKRLQANATSFNSYTAQWEKSASTGYESEGIHIEPPGWSEANPDTPWSAEAYATQRLESEGKEVATAGSLKAARLAKDEAQAASDAAWEGRATTTQPQATRQKEQAEPAEPWKKYGVTREVYKLAKGADENTLKTIMRMGDQPGKRDAAFNASAALQLQQKHGRDL